MADEIIMDVAHKINGGQVGSGGRGVGGISFGGGGGSDLTGGNLWVWKKALLTK